MGIETDRHVELFCALGPDTLLVRHFAGSEQLGECFEYLLTLYSLNHNVKAEDLLGTHASIRVRTAQTERFFDGMVFSFGHVGSKGRYAMYRMLLRPWLWMLAHNQDCRVFQHQTTPDIVKKIIMEHGLGPVDEVLMSSYQPREYCVQYRESEFSFISRLLEDEGIYYYFKHEKNKHTLVFTDSLSAHRPIPGFEKLSYGQLEDDKGEPGVFYDWSMTKRVQTGEIALLDYDFEKPLADLRVNCPDSQDHSHADGEFFDYPGRYKVVEAGNDRARAQIEERVAAYEVSEGETDAIGLFTGGLVTLAEHPRDDQNREYLLIGMRYEISSGAFESGDSAGAGKLIYRARVQAISGKTQFRTKRTTRRPVIAGVQTATVVGPAGQEIWTDKYGRVKVRFHWDREGKRSNDTSCCIRVAQPWAGARWGAIFIPRIGQEVVVDFLEGDPDQPIIVGSVYNNSNMPPYTLSANQTQSGIKTHSTKGGGRDNYNELRFEDKMGSEEIHMQAERDLTTNVKHDSSHQIENKLTVNVAESDYLTTVEKGQMVTKVLKDLFEVDAQEIHMHVGGNELHIEKQKISLVLAGVGGIGNTEILLMPGVMQVNGAIIKLNGA